MSKIFEKKRKKCWFCEDPFRIDNLRDHCQLTGIYGKAALYACKLNGEKTQEAFVLLRFDNPINCAFHLFFKAF